jgi:2'-phosphotransferase
MSTSEQVQTKSKVDVKTSIALSGVLRHQVVKLGLDIDSEGFVDVNQILKLGKFKNVTVDDIKRIVETNDKARFKLETRGDVLFVRANQGHSKDVGAELDDEKVLKKITEPLPVCVHGTYADVIKQIQKDGLKSQTRKHIHFATGLFGDPDVKSGIRKDCTALVYIDMKKAMEDGIEFFLSDNGVILTSGTNDVVLPKYFSNVVTRK